MTTATDMHGYNNATDVISDVQYNRSAAYDDATDVSNLTFEYIDIQDTPEFYSLLYMCWTLIMLLGTQGIVGNSLVIYVIMTCQGMRTVSNLLLVNLAAADLIFLITWLAYIIVLMSNVSHSVTITSYISALSVYVSIYTLTLTAVVRYLVVAHPHKSKRFVARKPIGGVLALIWIASFSFAITKVSALSIQNNCYLKILMGILTPSGGKLKISIVNLPGSFYPNKK